MRLRQRLADQHLAGKTFSFTENFQNRDSRSSSSDHFKELRSRLLFAGNLTRVMVSSVRNNGERELVKILLESCPSRALRDVFYDRRVIDTLIHGRDTGSR